MPNVVIIAGPNGSGKSTSAPALVHEYLGITKFVNADTIAAGLSAFDVETMALEAGRIMLTRLKELVQHRQDFAFETTLASRTYARSIKDWKKLGYQVHLLFLWLPSTEFAISRVQVRVREGGHHIPDEIVKRRYERGLSNFVNLYRPLVDNWQVYDSSSTRLQLIAQKSLDEIEVAQEGKWKQIEGYQS